MSLLRLLRTAATTVLTTPRLWLAPLSAALASSVVLAFALVGERRVLLELAAQLRATRLSTSFVELLSDAQTRLSTVAIVLIPVLLLLVLFWLERLGRAVLSVQRTAAPSLALPRRKGTLLAALARFAAGTLVVAAVLLFVIPRPATAPGLLGWIGGTIVFVSIVTFLFTLVVLLRPTTRTLARTSMKVLAANLPTFLGLMLVGVGEALILLALMGFPLFFALKLQAYGAALLAFGAVLLLVLPLLLFHVVSWSIFTLAGLEQQARLRSPAPTPA